MVARLLANDLEFGEFSIVLCIVFISVFQIDIVTSVRSTGIGEKLYFEFIMKDNRKLN